MDQAMGGNSAERSQVLVVGGGLVGLSAAMFLAERGITTVVVERHAGSSPHPRAVGFTPRTIELFNGVGLSPDVAGLPKSKALRKVRVESLAGPWYEEQLWTPPTGDVPQRAPEEFSPAVTTGIAQDRLEPQLRARAVQLGADVRMSSELLSFETGRERVRAVVRPANGADYVIEAEYLIAADGFRSFVREKLGIQRSGIGRIRTVSSVLFRAPLEEYLESGFTQFTIDQPGFAAFVASYHDGRWVLMLTDDDERDDRTLRDLVVRAVGRDDLDVDVITTGRWELSALIAERFSDGRVFLVGDAAHVLPPSRGGYGANTGIEDAHNLAWKIQAVLAGQSAPALLDTYDAERRPIAWLRHDQVFIRDDSFVRPDAARPAAELIEDAAMELGQLYRSDAVLGAGDDLPPAQRPDQWKGQPGTRAPHVWVQFGVERTSTTALLAHNWTLIAAGEEWRVATAAASKETGIPVTFWRIGSDLRATDDDLLEAFGLESGGASLVRPDGYVAWRSAGGADGPAELSGALMRVACASRAPAVELNARNS